MKIVFNSISSQLNTTSCYYPTSASFDNKPVSTMKVISMQTERHKVSYHSAKENDGDSTGDHDCIAPQYGMASPSKLHMYHYHVLSIKRASIITYGIYSI